MGLGLATIGLMTVGAMAPVAIAQTPLDIPAPTSVPTLDELLATSDESGDVQGIPLARTCSSARRRAISLPADDSAHRNTHYEYWWWIQSGPPRRIEGLA